MENKLKQTLADAGVIVCDICDKEIRKGEKYYAGYSLHSDNYKNTFNCCSLACVTKKYSDSDAYEFVAEYTELKEC